MKDNFESSLAHTLQFEGGWVNNPKDPGGETNLGVTKAVWEAWLGHPVTTMKGLTPSDVAPMYRKKYWDAVHADDMPKGIDYLLFDFAVNAGPGRSIKTLQQALGITADGAIGQGTMGAINAANPKDIIDKYSAEKESFYRSLSTFPTFGVGWLRRVAEVKQIAQSMTV
jgi:lysozyme family protein